MRGFHVPLCPDAPFILQAPLPLFSKDQGFTLRLALHCAHPQLRPAFSGNRPLGSSRLNCQPRYFCRTQRPPPFHLPNLGQSCMAPLAGVLVHLPEALTTTKSRPHHPLGSTVCACVLVCVYATSLQSCLCDPMNCSPPGSSVHRILQARILQWIARLSSRGSFYLRDQTHVSRVFCTGRRVLYHWCCLGSR